MCIRDSSNTEAPTTTEVIADSSSLIDLEGRMTLDLAAGETPVESWTVEPLVHWNDLVTEVGVKICKPREGLFRPCILVGGADFIAIAGFEGFSPFDPDDPWSFYRGTDLSPWTYEFVERGFAPLGDRTAEFGAVEVHNHEDGTDVYGVRFWYLPQSEILIEADASLGEDVERILATAVFTEG